MRRLAVVISFLLTAWMSLFPQTLMHRDAKLQGAEGFVISVIASIKNGAGLSVVVGGCDSLSFSRSEIDTWNLFANDDRLSVKVFGRGVSVAEGTCDVNGQNPDMLIGIRMSENQLYISADGHQLVTCPWSDCLSDEVLVYADGAGAKAERVMVSVDRPLSERLGTDFGGDTEALLKRLQRSSDPMEGEWLLFTRTLDDDKLRIGGEYRLACMKAGSGYQLVYLDGAKVNPGRWKPGMLKCQLKPTGFRGVWHVVWYDANGEPLSRDVTASLTEEGYLTINFPYHQSEVTLRRPDVR